MRPITALLLAFSSLFLLNVAAQTTVSGTIRDADGNTVPFATVLIESTDIGVQTDFDGEYIIKSDHPLPWVLIVRYVGYKDKRREITVGGPEDQY